MRFFRIPRWFRSFFASLDRKIFLPFMRRMVRMLSQSVKARSEGYHLRSAWKEKVLEDFTIWLEDLPDARPPGEGATMDVCDLYTLLSEFSALRQEIRLQNREQRKTLNTLSASIEFFQQTKDLFADRSRNLERLEERIRKGTEKRMVLPFLDVRDALVRGHTASMKVAQSKRFFLRPPSSEIEGILEGYEMAIRRLDRALSLGNIYPVKTVGQPFNPKTMKAVGKRAVANMEKGVVIEEQLGGFVRNDEVIRTAEVTVNA